MHVERPCPAGRAHCAWGDHFVVGIPCHGRMIFFRPPVGRQLNDPDQREGLCCSFRLVNLKRRVNARPTRSGPVRQDMSF